MPRRRSPGGRFAHVPRQGAGQRFTHEQDLTPWDEVARRWNAASGERLSKGVVWFICRNAERKLARLLEGERHARPR